MDCHPSVYSLSNPIVEKPTFFTPSEVSMTVLRKSDISLEVVEVPSYLSRIVFEITDIWEDIARKKIKETTDNHTFNNQVFFNITESIYNLNLKVENVSELRFFICRDKTRKTPYSIAVARDIQDNVASSLWISFMFSNPDQTKHALNPEAFRGAGIFLLNHLKQISIKEGKNSLSLKAIDRESEKFF